MAVYKFEFIKNGAVVYVIQSPTIREPKKLLKYMKIAVVDKKFITACIESDSMNTIIIFDAAELLQQAMVIKLNFNKNCDDVGIRFATKIAISLINDGNTPDEVAHKLKRKRATVDTYINRAKMLVIKKHPKAILSTYGGLINFLNTII